MNVPKGFIIEERGDCFPHLVTTLFIEGSTDWCASIDIGTIDKTLYRNLHKLDLAEHASLESNYAYITELEVVESKQGIGLGRYLLERAISQFRCSDTKYLYVQPFPLGTEDMPLETRIDKLNSLLKFYTKFGFELITQMQLQGVEIPVVLMRLDLSEESDSILLVTQKKSSIFSNNNKTYKSNRKEIQEYNIKRFMDMGSDYENNFYNLVEKHVGTGGPLRMGEELLSHIHQKALVPYDRLIAMNIFYYTTYDDDYDKNKTVEDFEKELRADMEPY